MKTDHNHSGEINMNKTFADFQIVANDAIHQIVSFYESFDYKTLPIQPKEWPIIGYSVNSDLPRGCLCPDPVREKLIGGRHRGSFRKNAPSNKRYQEYRGDDKLRLIRYYEFMDGDDESREPELFEEQHLVYDGDRCFGFGFYTDGAPAQIDLAEYEDGRIARYTETSVLDTIALHECHVFHYDQTEQLERADYISIVKALSYALIWKDGKLTYTCEAYYDDVF